MERDSPSTSRRLLSYPSRSVSATPSQNDIALSDFDAIYVNQSAQRLVSDTEHGLYPDEQSKQVGESSTKPILEWTQLLAVFLCLSACIIAFSVVCIDRLAWKLTYNNQLVAIGFLLSVMSLCLSHVVPMLFLLCEARFGNSKLQNFDAIKTNSMLGFSVDWWWRVALALLIALPLGLSAGYKLFDGGSAQVDVEPSSDLYNKSWGLNAPPGLLPLGWNTGILLMFNATLPFLTASTNQTSKTDAAYADQANDYPLPSFPHAYGFNTLLLNNQTAALLDAPPPEWISHVHSTIGENDNVTISASVLGIVTTFNPLVNKHRMSLTNDTWWNYGNGTGSDWESGIGMAEGWRSWFYTKSPKGYNSSFASPCFIGIYPPNSSPARNADMFDTFRRNCHGTWSVSRTTVALMNGDCDVSSDNGELMTNRTQLILTDNSSLALHQLYTTILTEYLPFIKRQTSVWILPTMAVTVASMYWSRIAASFGPSSIHWLGDDSYTMDSNGRKINVPHARLSYESPSTITWTRPAMRKSPLLFIILAILPALTVLTVLAIVALYQVPIGRGFGLVAIVAGLRKESAALLEGAGFSGRLQQPVYLGVSVSADTEQAGYRVDYELHERKVAKPARIRKRWLLS